MRVLMISWGYPPHVASGLGKHVAELAPALGQNRPGEATLAVDVLAPRFAGAAPVEPVSAALTIHRVDIPSPVPDPVRGMAVYHALFFEQGERLLQQNKYDLLHVHDWVTGTAGIRLKHRWNLPMVATVHSTSHGQHQRNLPRNRHQLDQIERNVCDEAAQIIVCSRFMRQEVHQAWGIPYDKIQVIANGVKARMGEVGSPAEVAALRQQYAPAGQKLLFFIGPATRKRGVLALVRAMPRILALHPNTRLVVAGAHGEKLQSLTYELYVEKAIEFLGYISDHQRDCFYQAVDATIIPSLYEPFGIVALEAMALGCNVIVSNVGGQAEIVRDGENGLLVHPDDPQSIVAAVDRLFANPVAAQTWRAQALHDVDTLYRWEQIAAQTIQVYRSVFSACA